MVLGIGAAIGISAGLNFLGGMSSRSSAKKARNREEAFLKMKYEQYDLPLWNMGKERLIAERDEMIRSIELTQRNEKNLAEFKDKNNLRNWRQQLKIQEAQHQGQLELYRRSNYFADEAIGSAKEQAAIEQFETRTQYAFQNEANLIESIEKKGQMRASGKAGVSAAKAAQSQLADEGRQLAILTENILSADRSSRMRLRDFILKTDAGRMLKPSAPIKALKPLATPLAEYQLPRELQDFDFGPQPIKGIATTPVPSMGSVIAGAATAAASTYATAKFGNNSFNTPKGGGTYGNILPNTSTSFTTYQAFNS